MADYIDDANDRAEFFLSVALHQRKLVAETPTQGTGACLNCSAKLRDLRRWCDADCRDEYEYIQQRSKKPAVYDDEA